MPKKVHQRKEIADALREAKSRGFITEKDTGGGGHKKYTIKCSKNKKQKECKNGMCYMQVYGTVDGPTAQKNIRHWMKKCGVEIKKERDKQKAKKELKAKRLALKALNKKTKSQDTGKDNE